MEQDKINAYMTLYTALVTLSKAAAPMIPFMTEEIYQNLVRTVDAGAPESIHLCDFPEVNEAWIDEKLEASMDEVMHIVVLGRAARNASAIKNRQPLAKMYVKADFVLDSFYTEIVTDELNVKALEFAEDLKVEYSIKPQLKTVGPKFGKLVGGIRQALGALDGAAAVAELNANGVIAIDVNGEKVELAREDLLIETAQTEGFVTQADQGVTVMLDTELTPELVEEGFVAELISKIQTMRKEAGFEVMDRIKVYAQDNEKIASVLTANKEKIAGIVLADDIVIGESTGYVKEWKINSEKVVLGVEKQ
jgi:isoleucyl-tRNA synthetase